MTSSRKQPGVAFWATVVVGLLILASVVLLLLSRVDVPKSPMPVF